MAKLIINGVEHDISFDFDLGEARIIKRYSGLSLNEIEDANQSDPDLVASFVHIAFMRRSPGVSFEEIEARVNKVKLASIDIREDEVDLRPPDRTPSGHDESDSTSGASSTNGVATTQEPESHEISGHPA